MATAKSLFDAFDTNKNGRISQDEVGEVLRKVGEARSAAQVAVLISQVDKDNDGEISKLELIQAAQRDPQFAVKILPKSLSHEMKMDQDAGGEANSNACLNAENKRLREALRNLKEEMAEERAARLSEMEAMEKEIAKEKAKAGTRSSMCQTDEEASKRPAQQRTSTCGTQASGGTGTDSKMVEDTLRKEGAALRLELEKAKQLADSQIADLERARQEDLVKVAAAEERHVAPWLPPGSSSGLQRRRPRRSR